MTDNTNIERHFDEASRFVHYDFPQGIHSVHDLADQVDQHRKETAHQREQDTLKLGPADLPTLTISPKDNSNFKELPVIPFLAAGALGGAAGSWAARPSADLSLLGKQRDFLGHIANSQIGSAADLELGKRLFSNRTDLSYYGDLFTRNNELLPKSSLSIARGPLGTLFEEGSASWLAKTLSGSGRGLLAAAGIMAIGYAWNQAGKMIAHNPHEK